MNDSVRIAELEAENARLTKLLEESGKEKMRMFLMSRDWATLCGKAEAQRDKLLAALKAVAEANGGLACYASKYDEIGEHACCGELSYEPHDPDCYVSVARAAIAEVEGK